MIKKHTLYLGLNDKDSKVQAVSTLEAVKIVQNLGVSLGFDGMTIFEADGIYKHNDGSVVIEKTLRIEILFSTDAAIKGFANKLKEVFNQESIALQSESVNSELI